MTSCCDDDLIYVRAGDAWTLQFAYTLDGVAIPLPDGARLAVTDAAGTVRFEATDGDGLTIDSAGGKIDLAADAIDTVAMFGSGPDGLELTMALKVFDTADEAGTAETLATAQVIMGRELVA